MTGGPDVSIVIPTRDRSDWLPRTVLSALRQEAVRTEVIVVDDGSRQPVDTVLSDRALERVRVIRHARASGVAAARNTGIAAARAPWIALLDDDDLWAPGKLRRQLDAAEAAGAEFAFCAAVTIDFHGRVVDFQRAPDAGADLYRRLLSAQAVPSMASSVIATAAVLERVGGFDTAFQHLADWDLTLRLSAAGAASSVAEPLLAYRLHHSNMQQDETGLRDELRRFTDKHAEARAEQGVLIDMAAWWRWRVSARRLARDRRSTAAAYLRLARATRRPEHAVRGATMWLGGERAMSLGRRVHGDGRPQVAAPAWLDAALSPSEDEVRALCR